MTFLFNTTKHPQGVIWIPIAVAILAVAAFAATAIIVYQENQKLPPANVNTSATISSFEACAAAGYPVMESHPRRCVANGQTFVEDVTNVNTGSNTNNATNTATNSSVQQNQNTNVAETRNSNINSNSVKIVTVAEAIANAAQYDDKELCLAGWYQSSFEFSAMAETHKLSGSRDVLDPPYVWAEAAVFESGLTCTISEAGQETCIGEIVQCGTFRFAAPGEKGFGHVAAYRYAIEGEIAAPSNTLKTIEEE